MKLITRAICKLSSSHKIQNVRSKFTKATVLKNINEPLVLEDFKIADNLNEGQVYYTTNFLLITYF